MRAEDIREFVTQRPFQPIRLTLIDGRTYEVRHPELIMVGRSSIIIGLPVPGEAEPVYDRIVMVSLLHVMQIEPQETTRSP